MMRVFLFLLVFNPVFAQEQTSVTLSTPSAFQIFQQVGGYGAIHIQGRAENAPFYTLSAQWGGFSSGVLYSGIDAAFDVVWRNLPIGQYPLTITINGVVSGTVEYVGIGDVYVIGGQSNAMGYGHNFQMYINALGLRAGMLTLSGWVELQDPTGKSADIHARGSLWPILATYILAQDIPVAFIPTAVGGTMIATWQPGGARYQTITRFLDTTTARAVLWQQGESDGQHNTPAKNYSALLTTLAQALYDAYHIPLFAARLYQDEYLEIDRGIDLAVTGNTFIYPGADLSYLKPDDLHYVSDEKLTQVAYAWYIALVCAGYYDDARIECAM